ncbi:MAG: glycosyltransferase [Sediminimonas qiaohouensis]|uniref:Glycosyltransferase n=1 Tax=Sediminimonas qiaohouensis TaxID=552061 RepID=A0A7C9HBV8_9RHOB|nr:glycosyltransferase [Sediminimonas qiaohouensis]MTJ04665.1 glycosyltransferase [Sediminimonas qiaohouensis]
MTHPTVSVVVVSRDRPDCLRLCLIALARLKYPAYEVVVVADAAGLEAVQTLPFAEQIIQVRCDIANISYARNLGIAAAAGRVVAFIDDDAVAEPRWLEHLAAPFSDPQVTAVGGYVRGRNGISFQWKARAVDQSGRSWPLDLPGTAPCAPTPPEGMAVRTEGTNMAIARDVLAGLGGFDPAYHFYLDETDLNMRLAAAGYRTMIAPLAQVHHASAPSAQRGKGRALRALDEVGASMAVFLRRHSPPKDHARHFDRFRDEQRRRVLGRMVSGAAEPRDVARLMASLERGIAEGKKRDLDDPLPPLTPPARPFAAFDTQANGQAAFLSGRIWNAGRLRRHAVELANDGVTVTLLLLSHTTLFHHVRFREQGYWEQRGGLFGKSERSDPLFSPWGMSKRSAREKERISLLR